MNILWRREVLVVVYIICLVMGMVILMGKLDDILFFMSLMIFVVGLICYYLFNMSGVKFSFY